MMEIAFVLLMVVVATSVKSGAAERHFCLCTLEFNEICGTNGVTYSNPCFARCSGVAIAHEGECPPKDVQFPAEGNNCGCPAIFRPVCGVDGRTYVNECEASCGGGVSVAYEGACTSRTTSPSAEYSRRLCLCLPIYAPVCGTDGQKYDNSCKAKCKRVDVAYKGNCRPMDESTPYPHPWSSSDPAECICPEIYKPVCGTDRKTYDNACKAKCRNVIDYEIGACSDVCTCNKAYEPVCHVITGTQYVNRCYARCLGVDSTLLKSCNNKPIQRPRPWPRPGPSTQGYRPRPRPRPKI